MSTLSREKRALERFAAVSAVICRVATGTSLSRAIAEVTNLPIFGLDGRAQHPSRATLYRWYAAYEAQKLVGLFDKVRPEGAAARALPNAFIDFMVAEKKVDPDASFPEIIRRAVVDGVVADGSLSRSTVWRTGTRLNLPVFGDKNSRHADVRRFEHEYRMRMVLCDGKHFRVGATKVKRMVFFFLDDATRKVLAAVVGSAEDRALFLRGLMKVIRKVGLMSGLYLDRGPAFTAKDSALVCSRLDIPLIFGRAGYPAGHGKVERFNQTCLNDLLRGLSADPSQDPSCEALVLQIEHYVSKIYNCRPHEGLNGDTPDQRWLRDEHDLRIPNDMRKVEDHFIVTESRRVARDNVVMLDDKPYEMPRGFRGQKVQVFRHFLTNHFTVIADGKHMQLGEVDLHANARDKRAKTEAAAEPPPTGKIRTAAQRAFIKDYASVVSPDGDFYEKDRPT